MSALLDGMEALCSEQGWNVFRIAQIHHGVPESRQIRPANRCQNSYSSAKAFTVTAIGILRDMGLVHLEDKPVEILREDIPENIDAKWQELTVEMALLHKMGLPQGFLDIDVQDANTFGMDFLAYLFSQPPMDGLGKEEIYTDAAYYLLARVAEKRAGMPLIAFLWQKLFRPMEFAEAAWSTCPMGHCMGATGLYITAEDLAKLGEAYLRGGMWKGKRLFSAQWAALVVEKGFELKPVGTGRAYAKGGMYGQTVMVVPEQDRVVAWHAHDHLGASPALRKFVLDWAGD